ncbi:hypothetical protein D3C72_1396720 [compost metagenome]
MRLRHEAGSEVRERLAHAPHARRGGVDVVEHAQQALAQHRIGRERIHVQAGVVLAPADRAAGDLAGPQRGAGARHVRDVFREQRAHQQFAVVGVAADQRVQVRQVLRTALGAAHRGVVGAQVDVLGLAVGIAAVKEALFARLEAEIQVREVQHGALLQLAAQVGAHLGGDVGRPFGIGLRADQVQRGRHGVGVEVRLPRILLRGQRGATWRPDNKKPRGSRRTGGVPDCRATDYRPAAARSTAALSVASHENSGSSRPKWP